MKGNRKTAVLLVLSVAILLGALVYHFRGRAQDQPAFRWARVEKGPITWAVSSSGTLNAVITVRVGSQVSGQIKELLVDYNSKVRQGQIIARIDSENFEAKVRQAEAELEVSRANVAIQRATVERSRAELKNAQAAFSAAKAQTEKTNAVVAEARRDLDRKRILYKNTIISKSEIDKAETAYDQALAQLNAASAEQRAQGSLVNSRKAILRMAEEQVVHALAQVKQREAALHQREIDSEHTIIRSPVDGVVIERSVDIGQTVAASLQAPTLFAIAQDLRKMQVETDIDEADIGRIRVGQRALFTVDAFPGQDFEGHVEQIRMAPRMLQNVVTYTVVVSAENPDVRLLPGMTANVRIVVDERAEAIKVPNSALRFRPPAKEKPPSSGSQSLLAGSTQGLQGSPREERLRRLMETLNLDDPQRAKISSILAKTREKIMAMRRQGAGPEDIRSEIERLRHKNRQVILTLLTPEQRDQFHRLVRSQMPSPMRTGQVWTLNPDGKLSSIKVVTGITDGSFTEIVEGDLTSGQRVIVGRLQLSKHGANALGRFRF